MLASRGPVYGTRLDAGGEGNKYHDHCDCVPVPVKGCWVPDDSPRGQHWEGQNPGYDHEHLYHTEYQPYWQENDTLKDTIKRKRAARRFVKMEERRNTRRASIDGTLQRAKWDEHRENCRNIASGRGIVIDQTRYKLPPANWEEPPKNWPTDLPLLRAKEWNHILFGDTHGGGHLNGYGWIHNRTEFKKEDTSEIIAERLKRFLSEKRTPTGRQGCWDFEEEGLKYRVSYSISNGKMRVTSFTRLEEGWT